MREPQSIVQRLQEIVCSVQEYDPGCLKKLDPKGVDPQKSWVDLNVWGISIHCAVERVFEVPIERAEFDRCHNIAELADYLAKKGVK